jgi:Secretion system C-terminal sorting domain
MKKTILTLLAIGIGLSQSFAQCSSTPNNFEMKLVPTSSNQLLVKMRYHDGAVADATSSLPTKSINLAGMVFAITWPSTSSITLQKSTSIVAPFAIEQDKTVGAGVANKNVVDNIATFYHTNDMPTVYGFDWKNDEWITIAEITYSGKLATNDYFSFVNCDYGIAHPNSYSGNSHTDPWFAMQNTSMELMQYSPKMITELPTKLADKISCDVYPVPTNGELHIDVEMTATSNAIVKVLDIKGTLVKTVQFELQAGKNKNTINLGELPSGDYMIVVTDGKALNFSKQILKN